jgi:hypothetical protein
MITWENWKIAVMAVTAYVAVTSLVRLMVRHRDASVQVLREQAEQASRRRHALRRKKQKQLWRTRVRKQQNNKAA